MTPAAIATRLARAQRRLALVAAARALLAAVASGAGLLAVLALLDVAVGLPLTLRRAALPTAAAVGALVLALESWRRVRPALAASAEAMALWFERRVPALRYALVTAVDPRTAAASAPLLGAVAAAPLEAEVARASWAALRRPAVAAGIALLAVLLSPRGAVARVTAPRAGDALDRVVLGESPVADPLATLVVRVRPPAYAGLREAVLDDPSAVRALAGSRVVVEGRGTGVTAAVGAAARGAEQVGARWRLVVDVPAAPLGVRLRAGARERVLVVEPVADSAPVVRLDLPARDSVLRTAAGTVALAAEARDDLGLADAAFEYIVSSGAGETFTFRSGRVGGRAFAAGTAGARIEAALRLDTLRLAPGDLVHLRAVARDRNGVSGPGVGASETRTLRLARPDEYDSVSVDPMPPTEPEKNALSQRMLLELTRDLRRRAPRIGPPATARESRQLAVEQTRLRRRVGEIVFTRLSESEAEHAHFAGDGHEHGAERPLDPDAVLAAAERAAGAGATRALESEGDETPVVAINRPMLEAYNHMWQAATALETAQPAAAIPWMERAIEALQRARAAERIYLRGRPPRVVVDLAKVRGTGRERGAPTAREARAPLDPARAARLARFDAALDTLARDPLAAADALLLLRLALPAEAAPEAEALTAAADAVRRGGDVTAALQRARRALAGAPVRTEGLGPWGS